MVQVKWFDIGNKGKIIAKSFTGELVEEKENSILFIYNGKYKALGKDNCFIFDLENERA